MVVVGGGGTGGYPAMQEDSPVEATVQVGRIALWPERYQATVDGRALALTLTQYRLLSQLARRPGWVISSQDYARRQDAAARESLAGSDGLKHQIAALRRALGPAAPQLQTVRGQGYRLVAEAAPSSTTAGGQADPGPRLNAFFDVSKVDAK